MDSGLLPGGAMHLFWWLQDQHSVLRNGTPAGQNTAAGPCTHLSQALPLQRRDLPLCSTVCFVPQKQNRDSIFCSLLGSGRGEDQKCKHHLLESQLDTQPRHILKGAHGFGPIVSYPHFPGLKGGCSRCQMLPKPLSWGRVSLLCPPGCSSASSAHQQRSTAM